MSDMVSLLMKPVHQVTFYEYHFCPKSLLQSKKFVCVHVLNTMQILKYKTQCGKTTDQMSKKSNMYEMVVTAECYCFIHWCTLQSLIAVTADSHTPLSSKSAASHWLLQPPLR